MLSRRDLIEKLAVCSAAVVATGVTRSGSAAAGVVANTGKVSASEDLQLGGLSEGAAMEAAKPAAEMAVPAPAALSEPAPWQLLQPLAMGSVVAHGWRVSDLSSVTDGSCVLTLQNERGRSHRVHLCRNDGRPQGLVYTDRLDLVVMNGGQGDLPTDEGFAQAVAEVAHVVAANEDKRQQEPVVVALMPHSERLRLFADAENARLR